MNEKPAASADGALPANNRTALRRAGGVAEAGWTLTGLDPDGCELVAGEAVLRLVFDTPPGESRPPLACLESLAASQSI